MKCLILAAGYATRLYPLTENFPKPLLKVGTKTILDWLIDDIDTIGLVDEYVVISNHKFAHHFTAWAETKSQKITILDDGTSTNETRLGAVKDIQFAIEHLGLDDEMLVIAAPGHEIAGLESLGLSELGRYELISQFRGSDHDVQQIFKRAGIRSQTKYILDDDISVMGMVAQTDAIALIPEMMLRTAGFELISRPLEPRQYRTIGLASPPHDETPVLVRTFAGFCTEQFGLHR
jgi:hypothetical protein